MKKSCQLSALFSVDYISNKKIGQLKLIKVKDIVYLFKKKLPFLKISFKNILCNCNVFKQNSLLK